MPLGQTINLNKGEISIKVNIEITREDYWQLNKYGLLNRNRRVIFLYLLGMPIFMFVLFLIMKLPIIYSLVTSIILGSAVNVFSYVRMKRRVKRLPSEKSGVLGSHLIELTEEGASEKTSVNFNFYNWDGINSVEENSDYIFIFIDKLLCHIIPKRDFKSKDEAHQFYIAAKAYFEIRFK
jgi:hypothetical protein